MQLIQLRYFIAVAEELSFRRAATRLHVSQPPLSFHIKSLEEEIGARLLDRTTRHVALTPAGSVLYERSKRVFSLLEDATDEVRDVATGIAGRLRVGFTISTSFHSTFYNSVHTYRRKYPEVKITFTQLISGHQIDAMTREQIDIGFIRLSPGKMLPGITHTPVDRAQLVLAIHCSHPLAALERIRLNRVKDEPFISYPSGVGVGIYEQVRELFERSGFKPNVVQEALEPSVIIGLVAAGLGVAIVPPSLAQIQIPGVLFKPIRDQNAVTTLHLIQRTGDLSPCVKAFSEIVLKSSAAATPLDSRSKQRLSPRRRNGPRPLVSEV
jgi:DNA-binding transcriptional LysR family regulator